ncbi:transposase [Singulisphaera sp. GP187]|uniref:transposase n=1 Tax=Singulisphaera sp. GP187 TaxID=1882752 RepID=UPI0009FB2B97
MAHGRHDLQRRVQDPSARLATEQGYTVKQAAQRLGVDQGSIRHWVRKFAPIPAPLAPNAMAEQLQRGNQRLREEISEW